MTKIGFEASGIRVGGGLKHLVETLNSEADPRDFGIHEVLVYGGEWLDRVQARPWLRKRQFEQLNAPFVRAQLWRVRHLPGMLRGECDLVYTPSGIYPGSNIKYVSQTQNMLVFELAERNRFPLSGNRLRYSALHWLQTRRLFRNSVANIYVTEHSKALIEGQVEAARTVPSAVIPYGATARFRQNPKPQQSIEHYSREHPFRLLYVSIVNFYKHQWNVVKAVRQLREKGYPVTLDLIGPAYPPALPRLEAELRGVEEYVNYRGPVPYESIEKAYQEADLYVFGSTCETMPNVLVEAMSAGLPIASSSYGPMKEILRDGGEYMDPCNPTSIAEAVELLLQSPEKRAEYAGRAFRYADEYSWERTARETYRFLAEIARSS